MILVTGANGFVGRALIERLLQEGFQVRALVRQPPPTGTPVASGLEYVIGDMRDAATLLAATRGATAVVHLAAAKSDEKDSLDINVGGARRLVVACRANGCERIINVSTISAKIPRKGLYGASKAQADEVFRQSALQVTTLLPSVIYGPDDRGVFGTIVRFIRKLPVVPVLGDGRWLSAPVHVADVAAVIVGSLRNARSAGSEYDIGGPELISFDELIDRIAACLGRSARKVHVPFALALAMARLLVLVPRAPITVSNVLGSNQSVSIDIAPARRDLGFAPRPLALGLAEAVTAAADQRNNVDRGKLAQESRQLGRYLLGCEPGAELIDRYVDARCRLRQAGELPTDTRWEFVQRHPWSLGFMDAAAGLLDRQSATRQHVLLMAAILEASPRHASHFLDAPAGKLAALTALAWQSVLSMGAIVVGLPLHFWARRQ